MLKHDLHFVIYIQNSGKKDISVYLLFNIYAQYL